jgi:hypothetical protein
MNCYKGVNFVKSVWLQTITKVSILLRSFGYKFL